MTMKLQFIFVIGLLCVAFNLAADSNRIEHDKGVYAKEEKLKALYQSMAPAIAKARRTYPRAKAKFLTGLGQGEYFFVVTRLRDKNGAEEQVFVSVSEIKDGNIHGYIYNEIQNVSGYEFRQRYSFPESQVFDWVITKPNGEQLGNYIGKFLKAKQ